MEKIDIDIQPNMKKRGGGYRQRIIAVALTCGIFLASLYATAYVLNSKNPAGILNLRFWEEKEENRRADILFIGSSTLSVNIELAELWQKYGIAGYCLGGGGMSMYDKYYRLLEAEKTASIKMCVIDARACTQSTEYRNYETTTENVSGLRWSVNKLDYVRVAIAPDERLDYFLEFPLYHDRYHSVSKWDFINSSYVGKEDKGTWTVFYGNRYTPILDSTKDIVTYRAFDVKQEYYLRKIIEHCQSNGIQLLIIKTPDADRKESQPVYNTAKLIAEEYGTPFLDFNLNEDKIGFAAFDFYYDANHVNIIGARKCADFLGDYLKANYQLTDHRGDAAYASWDRFAAHREDLYLRAITDRADYFDELVRDNKKVVAIPYHLSESNSEDYQKLQEQLAEIPHSNWDKEEVFYGEDCAGKFDFGSNEVIVTKNYDSCKITVNGKSGIEVQQPGLFLIVYDDVNDEIADIVEFERDNGYALKHLYSL